MRSHVPVTSVVVLKQAFDDHRPDASDVDRKAADVRARFLRRHGARGQRCLDRLLVTERRRGAVATTWKDLVGPASSSTDEQEKKTFRDLRALLVDAMSSSYWCTRDASCRHYGSRNPTSNVDVTIQSADLARSLDALIRLERFVLHALVRDASLVPLHRRRALLTHLLRTLDIHMYLSDFGRVTAPASPVAYGHQHFFALYERFKHDAEYGRQIEAWLEPFGVSSHVRLVRIVEAIQRERDPDRNVFLVSLLSTLEPEAYHTQGSFLHVVQSLQRGRSLDADVPEDALVASAVENLCFAATHADDKWDKYVGRARDALTRIRRPLRMTRCSRRIHARLSGLFRSKILRRAAVDAALDAVVAINVLHRTAS